MEILLVNGWTGFWAHVFFNTVFQPWLFTMKYWGILQIFPSFLSPPARAASTFLAYRGNSPSFQSFELLQVHGSMDDFDEVWFID